MANCPEIKYLETDTNVKNKRNKSKDAKIFENHLNPVMLVFIGKPSLSTHVPGFQSFFSVFASFCNDQISHQQQKGIAVNKKLRHH